MKFKLLFIGFLFIPLFSLSQKMKTVKGSMKDKTSAKFVLSDRDGCVITVDRGILIKNQEGILLESYIDSNWESGKILSVAVPADALSGECPTETLHADKQAADVSYAGVSKSRSSTPVPSYPCDSSEYLALKARADDYNSRSQDRSSMPIPSCTGGNSNNIPVCDSEEYRNAEREAQRSGNPIGPCRSLSNEGSQRRSSRGVR